MDDLNEVKRTLDHMEARLDTAIPRMVELLAKSAPTTNGQATVTISAGGPALWVATTCCAVMLATNLCLLFMLAGHDRKIERLEDYLQAIYSMAPHLKPKDG